MFGLHGPYHSGAGTSRPRYVVAPAWPRRFPASGQPSWWCISGLEFRRSDLARPGGDRGMPALLNVALRIGLREAWLAPDRAAWLLAVRNIAELCALVYYLTRRPGESVFLPAARAVLISATALPPRMNLADRHVPMPLRDRAGLLSIISCRGTARIRSNFPKSTWSGLALDPAGDRYIGVYTWQFRRGGRQLSDAAGGNRAGAGARAAPFPARRPRRRRGARIGERRFRPSPWSCARSSRALDPKSPARRGREVAA